MEESHSLLLYVVQRFNADQLSDCEAKIHVFYITQMKCNNIM